MRPEALLALADGTLFAGESIGAPGSGIGEVVFNTAMTGYQEILTDPSYAMQIITLTSAHIGNVGVNTDDEEAGVIHASGLVVNDLPLGWSNYRGQRGLSDYLVERGIVAIAGVDTRQLTRRLRQHGAQSGCVVAASSASAPDAAEAVAKARAFSGMDNLDLARVVTTTGSYSWCEGSWNGLDGFAIPEVNHLHWHVVAYDFGVKRNILRLLADHGCHTTVVPATTTADEALKLNPDGIFLSNGPGDPDPCDYAIDAIRSLLTTGIPMFGICLGHQLLSLACGARTLKMKFGHHGANHPVQDIDTGQVLITSQNHGFAVNEATLPSVLRATHRSLFDHSLQGVCHTQFPAFGFQGHPEASPGPHDITALFDRFTRSIQAAQARKAS